MLEVSSLKELRQSGFTRVSIACGNFDGVHRGHRAIIDKLIASAAKSSAEPVVLTFSPHPREVLQGIKVPTLTTPSLKKKLLSELGVKALITLPFSRELAAMPPDKFVDEILQLDGFEVCDLCIGSQWKFGAKRKGDVAFLKNGPWSFSVHGVEEVSDDCDFVSSSRIRQALAEGDFTTATYLLKREYGVFGPVVRGRGLASKELNFPTANIQISEQCLPLAGVFACMAKIEGEIEWRPAACNIGTAPTFSDKFPQNMRVEVHLIDYSADLYDKNIELIFKYFLRPEKHFDGIQQLKEQIAQDVNEARKILTQK
ncbi:MAG: riboflavin biosynthesis protein RibF [Lentisphaeraceae bacterium]|nr:riboflavin biosynthesis protein RibF [Lentisphaeraceae bacterium]